MNKNTLTKLLSFVSLLFLYFNRYGFFLEITTGNSLITLLNNCLLDTTSLWKSDLRVVTRSNNKDVLHPCAKGMSLGILHSCNVETSLVTLDMHELPNATNVMTLGEHDHGSEFGLEDISHLSSGNINLDGIIGLYIWVRVTDGAPIMGNYNWYLTGSDLGLHDLAKLVGLLLLGNTVKYKASLDIEKETEGITRLLKFYNVHESCRVVVVGTDLAVYPDTTFHADLDTLLTGEGVFKLVTKDDGYRKTFTFLVWSGRWLWGPYAAHLAEVPVLWCMDSLQVLLFSAYSPVYIYDDGKWINE